MSLLIILSNTNSASISSNAIPTQHSGGTIPNVQIKTPEEVELHPTNPRKDNPEAPLIGKDHEHRKDFFYKV